MKTSTKTPKATSKLATNKGVDEAIVNQLRRSAISINESFLRRSEMLNRAMNPQRNISQECGYPETIDATDYYDRHERDPIANRVNAILAEETWSVHPEVYESDKENVTTPFEQAWDAIAQSLRGGSWFDGKETNPIYDHLKRLDILSGIGRFGVMVIGIDDKKPMSEPVDGIDTDGNWDGKYRKRNIKFLREYDEHLVTIARYEQDKTSARYGLPVSYNIMIDSVDGSSTGPTAGSADMNTVSVHWTRVLHVIDNEMSSANFGNPRTQAVWDRLIDLGKLYGGSAEMYWKGAFYGLSFETNPDMGQVEFTTETLEKFRDQLEKYWAGLQRALLVPGASAKTLAPTVVDPKSQIEIALEAICIQLGIPIRIFKGSERGELSSSQDERQWNKRIMNRQNGHANVSILIAFVNRLIMIGCLPAPKKFKTHWPEMDAMTPAQKAEIGAKNTASLAQYTQAGIEALMTERSYYVTVLGWTADEADAIIKEKLEEISQEETNKGSPLLSMVGGVTAALEMFQKFKDGAISEETLKQLLMMFFKIDQERAEAIIADGGAILEEAKAAEEEKAAQEADLKAKALAQPQNGKANGSPFGKGANGKNGKPAPAPFGKQKPPAKPAARPFGAINNELNRGIDKLVEKFRKRKDKLKKTKGKGKKRQGV